MVVFNVNKEDTTDHGPSLVLMQVPLIVPATILSMDGRAPVVLAQLRSLPYAALLVLLALKEMIMVLTMLTLLNLQTPMVEINLLLLLLLLLACNILLDS